MASGNVKTQADLFKSIRYRCSYSISSGGTVEISANDFIDVSDDTRSMSPPTGYIAAAIRSYTSGSKYVSVARVYSTATGNGVAMTVHELNNLSRDLTAQITVLYVKAGYGIE